jgi:nucleotide-binding universal stress UspA family protein
MYERILVPLDGSEVGESALHQVEILLSRLSSEVKVEITLLQVLRRVLPYTIGGYGVIDVEYTIPETEAMKKRAFDYLNEVGEYLKAKGAIVIAKVEVCDASEEIIKVADGINADLIAMSTHGRSGLSRLAFGSVTDKVLRQGTKIPMLIVRAPGPERV